jgi:predicted GIY-YIG superfamily endonuclease
MEETYVYIIQRGYGSIKIGVAKSPESRCEQLQTANHQKLSIIAQIPCRSRDAAFSLEKFLHAKLVRFRLANGEWFRKSALQVLRSGGTLKDEHLEVSAEGLFNLTERFLVEVRKEFDGKPRTDLLRHIASLRRRNAKLTEFNEQRLAMLAAG